MLIKPKGYQDNCITRTKKRGGENKYEDVYCDELSSFIDGKIERPVGMSDEEYHEIAMRDSQIKMAF